MKDTFWVAVDYGIVEEAKRMGVNMIYGTLLKQLQLPPEQEQRLKDLLLDQQMENMSHAGDLMGAGGDRVEAMKKIGEEQKQRQEQMKELLGDEKYSQFEQYNQTMGERMMLLPVPIEKSFAEAGARRNDGHIAADDLFGCEA